jgi:hypothetical protein
MDLLPVSSLTEIESSLANCGKRFSRPWKWN